MKKYKTCTKCNEKKGLTEFYRAQKNNDKLCGSCKNCAKLSIYVRYHNGVREEGPRPCAICKKSAGSSTHRMKKSIICEKCNDIGYLMSGPVAEMVGVPKAGISGYLNEKKYHMVPLNDGFLNTKFAVWKPETVNAFVKAMPEICPIKIKAYIGLGYTRKKMAELFGIHSYYVFKYLRENNLRTSTKGVRCMEKGSQAYNRVEHAYDAANRIMNERVAL